MEILKVENVTKTFYMDGQEINALKNVSFTLDAGDITVILGPFAGVGGQPRDATNLDKNTPQPRIGGAFQISRKLVFRGGWGRYYFNPTNAAQQTYGYSQTTSLVRSLDGGETAIPNLINNPFPT